MKSYLLASSVALVAAMVAPAHAQSTGGIVIGTTDKVVSLDPARAYDNASWVLINNIYQKLMRFPPNSTIPEPDAATCEFVDPTTYSCSLAEGLSFSNGNPLTAEDVVFSFERVRTINDPSGPSSLLSALDTVEAPDSSTVVFKLKRPDQTFPSVIATGVGSIVDQDTFPADALLESDQVVGSGPYVLTAFRTGQQAVLQRNESYGGDVEFANEAVVVQYMQSSSSLKLAVEQGTVDVAYRALDPTDVADLRTKTDRVTVVDGPGTDIHFIGFNLGLEPGKEAAVRKAVAFTVDRRAILDNVYNGVGEPLYSMVTKGFDGYTEAYRDIYGEQPDLEKAKELLSEAGVQTPVKMTMWWTPSHYGPLSGDEFTEIKRQLDSSGLFEVQLQSTEWQQYIGAALGDQYAVYQLGGSADYPSALNALDGFYVNGGFLNNHYSNETINEIAEKAVSEPSEDARREMLAEIQRLYAEDAPTIPLWQGAQLAVTGIGVTGVAETLDPTSNIRFWMIGKQ